MRVGREAFEVKLHVLVHQLVLCQQVGEPPKFGVRGKSLVDDQVGGFKEGRVFGQLLDGNSAIPENSFFSVNKRNGTLAGASVPVAVIEGDQTGLVAQFADVNRALAGSAGNER